MRSPCTWPQVFINRISSIRFRVVVVERSQGFLLADRSSFLSDLVTKFWDKSTSIYSMQLSQWSGTALPRDYVHSFGVRIVRKKNHFGEIGLWSRVWKESVKSSEGHWEACANHNHMWIDMASPKQVIVQLLCLPSCTVINQLCAKL